MESFEPSEDLKTLLARLTAGQARAVTRIAEEVEVSGRSIDSLLNGPDKICAYSTYYRAKGGWNSNERLQAALQLARREVRAGQLGNVVNEAIEKLKLTTPLAAEDLRRQIIGDDEALAALSEVLLNEDYLSSITDRIHAALALAEIGTQKATSILVQALKKVGMWPEGEVVKIGDQVFGSLRQALLQALGASGHGSHVQRRLASFGVLDRADKRTADKGQRPGEGVVVYIPDNEREDNSETSAGAAGAVPGKPG